jgi:hypothetical protein
MTTCPNSDASFNKILVSLIGNSQPDTRKKIFYFMCIPIRFILYSLVFYYRDLSLLPIVIGIIAFITSIRLSESIIEKGNQWWSKRWQLFISIILVFVCIGVYFNKIDSRSMGLVLFISLLGGFIESLFVDFC